MTDAKRGQPLRALVRRKPVDRWVVVIQCHPRALELRRRHGSELAVDDALCVGRVAKQSKRGQHNRGAAHLAIVVGDKPAPTRLDAHNCARRQPVPRDPGLSKIARISYRLPDCGAPRAQMNGLRGRPVVRRCNCNRAGPPAPARRRRRVNVSDLHH